MRIASTTTVCPSCARPAQVVLYQHTDATGSDTQHELGFACSCGYSPSEDELIALWAATHTGAVT